MTIEVKLFATLRMSLGVASVSLDFAEPPTVHELIERIGTELGHDIREWLLADDGTLLMGTMILLDGHNIRHLDGLETRVTVPVVAIFPPAGGG